MFVGNDVNDIPAFGLVGFPVGVADCHPAIYSHILYRSRRAGGYGAVREICDLVAAAYDGDRIGVSKAYEA
jgi:3-deoxy-D-manno-octulosonate 8-phosphate phosphatase KdsC-like HAD superfamily phosphatase